MKYETRSCLIVSSRRVLLELNRLFQIYIDCDIDVDSIDGQTSIRGLKIVEGWLSVNACPYFSVFSNKDNKILDLGTSDLQ